MKDRAPHAFTLLEVLIALAILAGSFVALSDLTGSALRNFEYARDLDVAVLLARGRMAELEERYMDQGFSDFDEEEEGDFGDQGRADIHWRMELVRPNPDLTADDLIALLTGQQGGTITDLIQKFMGGAAQSSGGGNQPVTVASSIPEVAQMSGLIQSQLTPFIQSVKSSLRELRLTVSWPAGKERRSFTVVTHMVVLNPLAPGGARGDNPDIPPNVLVQGLVGGVPAAGSGVPANPTGAGTGR